MKMNSEQRFSLHNVDWRVAAAEAVTDVAYDIAAAIAGERPAFDASWFEVTGAFFYGSAATGEAVVGESDIDILLIVPPWQADSREAQYQQVTDDITRGIAARTPWELVGEMPAGIVTSFDAALLPPVVVNRMDTILYTPQDMTAVTGAEAARTGF